ncbi:MAG: hypothetical protein OXI77_11585 [Chloroflexota bacterium]|nr:hypothetical protein [Chloroflexota bacterium]MDE2909555.1 hypothetical protein [Chloroflexota bacterium]
MIETPALNVLDVVAEFLASDPSDEELLAYRFSDDLQDRVHDLLDRNGEGELTFYEERELEDFIRANRMLALLKVKTRLRLKGIDD